MNRFRYGAGIFPPFVPLAAIHHDATVFRHPRPTGVHTVLFQQFGNDGVGRIFTTQFHNGIMERFQIAEGNAVGIGLIFLNRFAEKFKIGHWW